jgi:hypothetical protein
MRYQSSPAVAVKQRKIGVQLINLLVLGIILTTIEIAAY